ncbi:hypothetical protein QJQ45_004161 [Haematococcus lacustris]|nr:hypothetical protein QJQ45_004161 [Haematococcus lacustris]
MSGGVATQMPPSTSSPPSHSLACQAVAPILVCGAVALSAEGAEEDAGEGKAREGKVVGQAPAKREQEGAGPGAGGGSEGVGQMNGPSPGEGGASDTVRLQERGEAGEGGGHEEEVSVPRGFEDTYYEGEEGEEGEEEGEAGEAGEAGEEGEEEGEEEVEVEDVELGATAAWAEGMAELELLAPGVKDSAALGTEQQQQQQEEEEEAGQGPVTTAAAAAAEGGVPAARGPVACGVCGEAAAKYCCPGCRQRTCSLACSRAHKAASGCSGQRDRLGFVPLAQFNDRHLMSDYRLLEEVARVDDVARRRLPPGARALLPPALQSLVYQAGRRRVNLLLMPPGMHKRRSNSTRYDGAARKLSWRVEWVFKSAGVRLADESVAEDAVLQAVLQRHLDYAPGAASKHFALRKYTDAGLPALKVFMRKEGTPANAPGYYAVDLSRPLGSQLAGKLVVEYPCLLVALPGEESEFPSAFTHHPKPGGEGASAAGAGWGGHPGGGPGQAICLAGGWVVRQG